MSAPSHEQLRTCIAQTLRGILAQQGKPDPGPVDDGTALFGSDGLLDSMGLVTLVVEVEQVLAEQFGMAMTLADDRAMSQRSSPFRSIGTLVDYILQNGKVPHAG